MKLLFCDTESTGIPVWDQPSDDEQQPHLVQIACKQVDLDSKKTLQSINLVIRPEGWSIPDEVVAIHGISEDFANEVGQSEREATLLYWQLAQCSDAFVAHNTTFDKRMMRTAIMRYMGRAAADEFKAIKHLCTMRTGQKMLGGKWPKLQDIYYEIFSETYDNAHDAMADVNACERVFYALQDNGFVDL